MFALHCLFLLFVSGPLSPVHDITFKDSTLQANITYQVADDPATVNSESDLGPTVAKGHLTITYQHRKRIFDLTKFFPEYEGHLTIPDPKEHCGAGPPLSRYHSYLIFQVNIVGKGCLSEVRFIDILSGQVAQPSGVDYLYDHRYELHPPPFRSQKVWITQVDQVPIVEQDIYADNNLLKQTPWHHLILHTSDSHGRSALYDIDFKDFFPTASTKYTKAYPKPHSQATIGRFDHSQSSRQGDAVYIRFDHNTELRYAQHQPYWTPLRGRAEKYLQWNFAEEASLEANDFNRALYALSQKLQYKDGSLNDKALYLRTYDRCEALAQLVQAHQLSSSIARSLWSKGCISYEESRGEPSKPTSVTLTRSAQSLPWTEMGDLGGTVSFPSNNAESGTTLTVRSNKNTFLPAEPKLDGTLIGNLEMSVDKDVTFTQYPTFSLTKQDPYSSTYQFIMLIRDGLDGRIVARIDPFKVCLYFSPSTSTANPLHPMVMKAHHPYIAQLVDGPSYITFNYLQPELTHVPLPPSDGYSGVMHLPAITQTAGAIRLESSTQAPLWAPALEPSTLIHSTIWYLSGWAFDHPVLRGPSSLDITLPSTEPDQMYGLAVFDESKALHGWQQVLSQPVKSQNHLLHLNLYFYSVPMYYRRLAVALYPIHLYPKLQTTRPTPSPIAIIGDGFSQVTMLPSTNCRPQSFYPAPACQSIFDPHLTYAHLLEQMINQPIDNLSWIGSRVLYSLDDTEAEQTLAMHSLGQTTETVIFAGGTQEFIDGKSFSVKGYLDIVTSSIRLCAPRAKIIYLGTRNPFPLNGDEKLAKRVKEWNAYEAELGKIYGSYLDLSLLFTPGPSAEVPDGMHLSPLGAQRLATVLQNLIIQAGNQQHKTSTIPVSETK